MKKLFDFGSIATILVVSCYLFFFWRNSGADQIYVTPTPTPVPTQANIPFVKFPVGKAQPVSLDWDTTTSDQWQELSSRERQDQIRDWLLYAIVSASGQPTDTVNKILFDAPPVRKAYLRPIYHFEYGTTRSVMLPDKSVIALVPANVKAPQRLADLAHIADEHRKNSDEIPGSLVVFEYSIGAGEKNASVTRRTSIKGDDFFTPRYGYHEMKVADLKSFQTFIGRIDDLVFARAEGNVLQLGGRRTEGHREKGLRVEDVAALWQAQNKLQQRLTNFEAKWQKRQQAIEDKYNRKYHDIQEQHKWDHSYTITHPLVKEILQEQRDEEVEKLRASQKKEALKLHIVRALGFSLDPAVDFKFLQIAFDKQRSRLAEIRKSNNLSQNPVGQKEFSNEELTQVEYGLDNQNEVPLLILLDKLDAVWGRIYVDSLNEYIQLYSKRRELRAVQDRIHAVDEEIKILSRSSGEEHSDSSIQQSEKIKNEAYLATLKPQEEELKDNVEFLEKEYANLSAQLVAITDLQKSKEGSGYQHARYDGDLKGTEVGMVMFYTDLLAKLWMFDYGSSTPSRKIANFNSVLAVHISPFYTAEIDKLPNTRLWLGPENQGFQPSDDHVLFGQKATRIYAASSNPLNPGIEQSPNAEAGTFLYWWNDHYNEVAEFEPQYQRLNQIMKWSLLFSWFSKKDCLQVLGYLKKDNVIVKSDNWFPDWASNQKDLRFNRWRDVDFYRRNDKDSHTETMPLLESDGYEQYGLSYRYKGGVSLGSELDFRNRPSVSQSISESFIRRANLADDSSASLLKTREGTEFSIKALNEEGVNPNALPKRIVEGELSSAARVVAEVKAGTKLRASFADLNDSDGVFVVRNIRVTESELRMEAIAGKTEIGQLDISCGSKGIDLVWQARRLDQAHSLARKVSIKPNIQEALLADERVELLLAVPRTKDAATSGTAAQKNSTVYILKLRDCDGWLQMAEGDTAVALEGQWQSRVSALEAGAKQMNVANIDRAVVAKSAKNIDAKWLKGDAITSSEELATFNPGKAPRSDEVLHTLVSSPEAFKKEQATQIATVDHLLKLHRSNLAIERLNSLIECYGPLPELTLRKAVAELQTGDISTAARSLGFEKEVVGFPQFLDEINVRAAGVTDANQRRSLLDMAAFADYRQNARRHLRVERANGVVKDGVFSMESYLKGPLSEAGHPTRVEAALKGANQGAPVYIDQAGLNNIDWTAPLDKALKQALSGNVAEVVRLPRGDISHFQPAVIYAPIEHGTSTHSSAKYQRVTTSVATRYNQIDKDDSCSANTSDSDACNVYIVRHK